jgi:hypothetical protein
MDYDSGDILISNIDLNQKNQEKIIKYALTQKNYSSLMTDILTIGIDAMKEYLDNNPKIMNKILYELKSKKLLIKVFNKKYDENINNKLKKKILSKIYLKIIYDYL